MSPEIFYDLLLICDLISPQTVKDAAGSFQSLASKAKSYLYLKVTGT